MLKEGLYYNARGDELQIRRRQTTDIYLVGSVTYYNAILGPTFSMDPNEKLSDQWMPEHVYKATKKFDKELEELVDGT